MNRSTRYQLIIVALAAVAFFTNLGATSLWDQDEAYFAGTAAEMHARGDWVTPYFNGEMFGHKPPFMFWMMMIGYKLLGVTSLAARLPCALFGVGTALLTYHLGRRLFSAQVGLKSSPRHRPYLMDVALLQGRAHLGTQVAPRGVDACRLAHPGTTALGKF